METSREDFGIAIRSAFLKKGVQQRFSLFALILFSCVLLFFETVENKPLNYIRFFFKDLVYRSSTIISSPVRGVKYIFSSAEEHINVYGKYEKLKKENIQLKNQKHDPDFLIFENKQLRKLLEEQEISTATLISSRVMMDKQSPFLNSLIINSGVNKKIKKGMAVLDGNNFIGKIVDVNFFSSRILLVTDLNSKIPVMVEPTGNHAVLSGTGHNEPILDFLPENNAVQTGNKVYTSGKGGIFSPGIPIGQVRKDNGKFFVSLFSELSQITFVNIALGEKQMQNN